MKIKLSGITPIALFFAITIIVFLAWILGLFYLLPMIQHIDSQANLIATIEALSTALAASAVFGAGYIAYSELSEVANSRYMEVADRLFDELNSPESIEARRRIFQNLHANPEIGLKKLTIKDRDAMKTVLNSLDRVAFLTQENWIPDEMVMPWMHPMIAKSWEKLEPYVLYERKRRNEPYYYQYAEQLAERCKQWRQKNLKDTKTTWVEKAL